MVVTTWDTMANKIKIALQSGTGPDVVTELTSRVPTYANRGELADLTGWYEGTALPVADVNTAALQAVTIDDAVYAVPFRWDAGSMIYNEELFAEAGIDSPPSTTAELEATAQELAAAGITAYAWPFGNNENTQVRWLDRYYSHGGQFTTTDDGQVQIDAAASTAALEDLARGFDTGYVSKSSFESDNTGLRELFANGEIALYFGGAFDIAPLTEAGVEVGTASWPGPAGPGAVSADGFSLMVPESAENPAAAKALIEFLGSAENQARLTQTFPARLSSSEDDKFSDPLLQPFLEQLNEHGQPRPTFEGYSSMVDTIYSVVQRVSLGELSPQQGTEEIQAQAQNVLRAG